ncbi:hypothetical protein PCE1_000504 [Barthelona sp. PCE]
MTNTNEDNDIQVAHEGIRRKKRNKPKRNMTAFMFFIQERRVAFRQQNPDVPITTIVKQLATQWKSMDSSEKLTYEKMARNDRIRYEAEVAAQVAAQQDELEILAPKLE